MNSTTTAAAHNMFASQLLKQQQPINSFAGICTDKNNTVLQTVSFFSNHIDSTNNNGTLPAAEILNAPDASNFIPEHLLGLRHVQDTYLNSEQLLEVSRQAVYNYGLNTSPAIDPISLMTTTEHLENVRDVLGLPISRLAQLLEISRQAVYKWMRGESEPDGHNAKILEKLGRIAYKFHENKVRHPSAMLNMKAFGKKSLLDIILAGGELDDSHIARLLDIAKKMEQERERAHKALAKSKATPNNDWELTMFPGSHNLLDDT